MGRRLWVACVLALLVAAPAEGAESKLTQVSAGELVRDLRAGKPVVRRRLLVEGPLVLTGTEVVARVFRCRECTFLGRVAAPDVTFARTVDLSGSTFERGVVFRGASFRGPALFRPTSERGGTEMALEFKGVADFALVTFEDFATFGESTFARLASFRDARFADVTFTRTHFVEGTFAQASFRGAARFNGASFSGHASFDDAEFREHTTFSLARFSRGASFTGVQFAKGATFFKTTFSTFVDGGSKGSRQVEEPAGAKFQNAASAGTLDFTYATFALDKGPVGTPVAFFEDVVCSAAVVFRAAKVQGPIGITRLQARDLVLDVDVVERVEGEDDQRTTLEMIEESAKGRGDLEVANDARYELQRRRSEDYSPVGRALDLVFYRGVAGYLVRPSHPLAALVGLATLMAVLRARRLPRTDDARDDRRSRFLGRSWRRVVGGGVDFLTCFLDALGRAAPRFGASSGGELTLGDRIELLAYRLLAVCTLIALANSNPTLRQMVDTLF